MEESTKTKKETTKPAAKKAEEGTVVQFKSNGKCKHMPKDGVYEVSAEIANLFIDLNYGTIID